MTTHHNKGAIIWLTGLSGSGKTTLALALKALLEKKKIATILLDGDELRKGLCVDLGFSIEDRAENIRRTGEVAKLFAKVGWVVICAVISPIQEARAKVRLSCHSDMIPFYEVFVDAPLSVCEERDPKGLYKKVRSGEITNFTGIDSSYETPIKPDLHLPTAQLSCHEAIEELAVFFTSVNVF